MAAAGVVATAPREAARQATESKREGSRGIEPVTLATRSKTVQYWPAFDEGEGRNPGVAPMENGIQAAIDDQPAPSQGAIAGEQGRPAVVMFSF